MIALIAKMKTCVPSRSSRSCLQNTFGRALELEAGNELADNVDERFTGEPMKSTRGMSDRFPFLSAVELREALSASKNALKIIVLLPEKVNRAMSFRAGKKYQKYLLVKKFRA